MTITQFTNYYKAIEKAGKDSDIWFFGMMFTEMTTTQFSRIQTLLSRKVAEGVIDLVNANGSNWFQFPNGLRIRAN